MKYARVVFFLLFLCIPLLANAGLKNENFPGGAVWYLHADLKQMRASESGSPLYQWLHGEVFVEIHDELGIDINRETDWITAYSRPDTGTVVMVGGNMTKESQDKLLAVVSAENELDIREHRDRTYYHVGDLAASEEQEDSPLEALADSAFFSFAVKGKLLVASNEDQLKALIDNGGKVAGSESHEGALLVLTADKSFVQAGLKTDQLGDDDDHDWNSNIIRNTEQAAVMLSDMDGMIAVEAKLVSADPLLTQSIGGIVNGLISLQAFNDELDPDIRVLLQNTKIDVNEKVLTISTVIDPKVALAVLDD